MSDSGWFKRNMGRDRTAQEQETVNYYNRPPHAAFHLERFPLPPHIKEHLGNGIDAAQMEHHNISFPSASRRLCSLLSQGHAGFNPPDHGGGRGSPCPPSSPVQEIPFPPAYMPFNGGYVLGPNSTSGPLYSAFQQLLEGDGRGPSWDLARNNTERMAGAPELLISGFGGGGMKGRVAHVFSCLLPAADPCHGSPLGIRSGFWDNNDPRFPPIAYDAHMVALSWLHEDRYNAMSAFGLWQYNSSFLRPNNFWARVMAGKLDTVRVVAYLPTLAHRHGTWASHMLPVYGSLFAAAFHSGRLPGLPWAEAGRYRNHQAGGHLSDAIPRGKFGCQHGHCHERGMCYFSLRPDGTRCSPQLALNIMILLGKNHG